MKCYKIKVGIEEYPIKEADIPRIAEAMKTNDIVKLDCGLFRGQAILAVCRDEKEEIRQALLSAPSSQESRLLLEREAKIRKQTQDCQLCNHTGWVFVDRNGEQTAKYCECTYLRELSPPQHD